MESKYKYIVIEGNIGAGKTSLATKISETYKSRLLLERFADNPFLPKFYDNPSRYSFPLELSFLADRYQQLKEELGPLDMFSPFTVADYFFMKSLIFASSTLDGDEYKLYRQIFYIIYNTLPKPDLFVFLYVNPDKLIQNIAKRGREYEASIKEEYLKNIHESYFTYFNQNPENRYLILNTNDIDFVNNQSDYENVLDAIFNNDLPIGLNRLFF